MHRSSSIPPHHRSRRAMRRQKMRRLVWVAVVSLITLWALGAGYLWRQLRTKNAAPQAPAEQTTPEQRARALQLLDRAVTAKHGELTNEAVRLALDARRLDADVPGAALLLAEMSLRAGDAEGVNAAAKEALAQENYSADAQLLLALNAWMLRGQRGSGDAGRTSTQLLAEASEVELANSQVRFFAGDVLRAIGQPAEAHASLLGSLHRQGPWDSAALLIAKLWMALEEAGPQAQSGAKLATGREGEIFGDNAVQVQRAVQNESGEVRLASALQAVLTAKQLSELASDPALIGAVMKAVLPVGEQLSPPFAQAKMLGSPPMETQKQDSNSPAGKRFQIQNESGGDDRGTPFDLFQGP